LVRRKWKFVCSLAKESKGLKNEKVVVHDSCFCNLKLIYSRKQRYDQLLFKHSLMLAASTISFRLHITLWFCFISWYILLLMFSLQGFVTTVKETRTYIPAIYDCTFIVPKSEPSPTLLRIFKGIPCSVRQLKTFLDSN
jgi:hypothetical protein